jgi:hypothetical protein
MKNYVLLFLFCLLIACASLEASISEKLLPLVKSGKLTPDQYEQIMAIYREAQSSGSDWIARAIEIGGSVILSLFGVRLWRGGVTTRKGVSPHA